MDNSKISIEPKKDKLGLFKIDEDPNSLKSSVINGNNSSNMKIGEEYIENSDENNFHLNWGFVLGPLDYLNYYLA